MTKKLIEELQNQNIINFKDELDRILKDKIKEMINSKDIDELLSSDYNKNQAFLKKSKPVFDKE